MSKWQELKSNFEDCNDDFDFEDWEFHNLVCLEYDVCRELGITVEPSTQCGIGGIWIYDNDDNVLVENYDYTTFLDCVLRCALDSSSDEEFKNNYKRYLEGIIE